MNVSTVIDMHMHLCARCDGLFQSRPYGKVQLQDGSSLQAMPPSFVDTSSPPEVALAYMDWCGVDRAVLLQGPLYGTQNSFYLDVIRRWPERFMAFALVDPTEGVCAAMELRKCAENGFLGLKLEIEALRKFRPDFSFLGKREMSVWEVCAENNMPIFLHLTPDARSVQEGEDLLKLLKRWPHLSFVICHIGMPPFEGWQQRVLLAQHPNICLETAAFYWHYQDEETYPYPSGLEALHWAVETVGVDKILWGSDYPGALMLTTYKQAIDIIRHEAEFLSPEMRIKILGGNAKRLVAEWQRSRSDGKHVLT